MFKCAFVKMFKKYKSLPKLYKLKLLSYVPLLAVIITPLTYQYQTAYLGTLCLTTCLVLYLLWCDIKSFRNN